MNQIITAPTKVRNDEGTTLVEVSIVMAIMLLLIAMAVPVYSSAIDIAEEQAAISDINSIADAVNSFFVSNGVLPKTLQQVGMDNTKDPWGNPYIYKPVDGSDGTEPVPAAADPKAAEKSGKDPKSIKKGKQLATRLTKMPTTAKAKFLTNAQGFVTIDIEGDGIIDLVLPELSMEDVVRIYTATLKLGKDGIPINSDYDLFSMGKDGDTDDRIDDDRAKDDIIRARGGNFVNRADEY